MGDFAYDTHSERDEMARISEKNKIMAKETNSLLRRLDDMVSKLPHSSQDFKQERMRVQKLSKDFGAVLVRFDALQRESIEKQKQFKIVAAYNRNDTHQNDDDASLLQVQTQEQSMEYNAELIQKREEGIKEIESTIIEVNDIFRDLGSMVKDQGTMVMCWCIKS